LGVLENELIEYSEMVAVFVFDNASTDATSEVVKNFATRIKLFFSYRNEFNVGGDANIRLAYEVPKTDYIWILGDDDAPIRGSLKIVMSTITNYSPDMIYLPSVGRPNIISIYDNFVASKNELLFLSKYSFASQVHAMFTFISGNIIRKNIVQATNLSLALKITSETSLVQLAWVYEALKSGSKFVSYRQTLLLSSSTSSGGYGLISVLLKNQIEIIKKMFASDDSVRQVLISRNLLLYFPQLVWAMRNRQMGAFEIQSINSVEIPNEVSEKYSFRTLVSPIWTGKWMIAWCVFQIARLVGRLIREKDRVKYVSIRMLRSHCNDVEKDLYL